MTCSFCDRTAKFGPYRNARVCDSCARRIAALARRGGSRVLERVWSTLESTASHPRPDQAVELDAEGHTEGLFAEFKRGVGEQISDEDADSHLNLAIAYCEMSLYGDAVRELSVVIEGTRDDKMVNNALALLLAPPLLRRTGLDALRTQLSSH